MDKKRVINVFDSNRKLPRKKRPTDCVEYYASKAGFGYSAGKRENRKEIFPIFEDNKPKSLIKSKNKKSSQQRRKQWQQLKDYWNKYDCSMTVYYYDYNPLTEKAIKLDCNQSYQDLDLDVNSMSSGSLKRVKAKPTNITAYNKGIEHFFVNKLGLEVLDTLRKPKSIIDVPEEELITVDVLKEFKKITLMSPLSKGIISNIECSDKGKLVIENVVEPCKIALYTVDIMAGSRYTGKNIR